MTEYDKGVIKRLGIVIAVLAGIGALIGLMLFPPLAIFILIGGVLLWGALALSWVIIGYIFNGH